MLYNAGKLSKALQYLDLTTVQHVASILSTYWMLPLYTGSLPKDITMCIWDIMFSEGSICVLQRLALSMMVTSCEALTKVNGGDHIDERGSIWCYSVFTRNI